MPSTATSRTWLTTVALLGTAGLIGCLEPQPAHGEVSDETPEDASPPREAPAAPSPHTATECRVPDQRCECADGEGTSTSGGISYCGNRGAACSQTRLEVLTARQLEDAQLLCRTITFDDLAEGSALPADYLTGGITLTTRGDCPPVVMPTTDGAPGEKSLVTCAAALGDVALHFASATVVGIVLDRPSIASSPRDEFLLRAYDGTDPYRINVLSTRILVDAGEYAAMTSFSKDEVDATVGLASTFSEPIARLDIAVASDCSATSSGAVPDALPLRIAEIVMCSPR